MISRVLALRLREAGLVWHPATGDRFQFLTQDMDSTGTDAFTVSDMTVEAHTFPTGTVLGFNGTTEWALDSIAIEEALWLPREDQLRDALRSTFEALEVDRKHGGWRVTCTFLGERMSHLADTPADAYAMAVLAEVQAAA